MSTKPMIEHSGTATVSVIIPCYNQAQFLAEAIDSVLAQTFSAHEIIVIDDGSTDNTAEVTARYVDIHNNLHYIRQENAGLSAARNTGWQTSTGNLLVFLDSDDRLLPNALAAGVNYLDTHPTCAFVSGHFRRIDATGNVLPAWREERTGDEQCFVSGNFKLIDGNGKVVKTRRMPKVASEHYVAFLQRNYISMHATVMYRREVFNHVGGFDPSLRACEDYDLYLRISHQFPVGCHEEEIADYRRHGKNMTGNSAWMLHWVLTTLQRQEHFIVGKPIYEHAYRKGLQQWRATYAQEALGEVRACLDQKAWGKLLRASQLPVQYWATKGVQTALDQTKLGWYHLNLQRKRRTKKPVDFGDLRNLATLQTSEKQSGKLAIDQYYVNQFLQKHAVSVTGDVLKIDSVLIDKLDSLTPASYDCIILPQMLNRVPNPKATLVAIHRLLKPSAVLLATVSAINCKPSSEGIHRGFMQRAVERLFTEFFPGDNCTIITYGNVLTTTALLNGLPAETLSQQELDSRDSQYQVVIGIRAKKSSA